MFTEIHAAYRFVRDDLIRAAGGEHSALVDDVGAIANAQGFSNIVVSDEYTDAARLQEPYDALYLDHRDRINASKRLIQQDETWSGGQCACDFYAATLTTRERQRGVVTQIFNLQLRQQGIQALLDFRVGQWFTVIFL